MRERGSAGFWLWKPSRVWVHVWVNIKRNQKLIGSYHPATPVAMVVEHLSCTPAVSVAFDRLCVSVVSKIQ